MGWHARRFLNSVQRTHDCYDVEPTKVVVSDRYFKIGSFMWRNADTATKLGDVVMVHVPFGSLSGLHHHAFVVVNGLVEVWHRERA